MQLSQANQSHLWTAVTSGALASHPPPPPPPPTVQAAHSSGVTPPALPSPPPSFFPPCPPRPLLFMLSPIHPSMPSCTLPASSASCTFSHVPASPQLYPFVIGQIPYLLLLGPALCTSPCLVGRRPGVITASAIAAQHHSLPPTALHLLLPLDALACPPPLHAPSQWLASAAGAATEADASAGEGRLVAEVGGVRSWREVEMAMRVVPGVQAEHAGGAAGTGMEELTIGAARAAALPHLARCFAPLPVRGMAAAEEVPLVAHSSAASAAAAAAAPAAVDAGPVGAERVEERGDEGSEREQQGAGRKLIDDQQGQALPTRCAFQGTEHHSNSGHLTHHCSLHPHSSTAGLPHRVIVTDPLRSRAMDYADAEVCVDALFACPPIDPFPLDFPLDPFPPSAFLFDSTPLDASFFDSCSGAFPGDHQHHQLPCRDSLSADQPIPHAVAAPRSPVRHPCPSQQLQPPPALTAASASSLPRGGPASLISAAALPETVVCTSSNGSGGAGGREQAGEGGNVAEQLEHPPRGAAAPLHRGVVPPPATASANSDAQSYARAAAPRGSACRPADLTGRLAAVLKGLAEGARDGNRRAAELARSDGRDGAEVRGDAWGAATGAKRDVDGRRGWREARNGDGEGERRKRTCVGSTGREGEQNGGARVGGAAVVCAAQGGVAAVVAAGEAEAAGMAEQAAALAGAAAQEGVALLAHAQAVAAEGRAAHRRGEGELGQTGRSAREPREEEQQEDMRGETALSRRSAAAAAAAAVGGETTALWFTPPLSRRLQVSWAGDGVAAGMMGGAQQEAEAVRVRNLVMALGEAHATQDTVSADTL
ncbi:unnamed protein product [Closterium sp. Naga37s-1]|nr:unnamed protein product [Closterium sp. Naga37s-1]